MRKETKMTTVRIPVDLYDEIQKESVENERKVGSQINYMLRKYFEFTKRGNING
ncbi:hypothetical protein [Anaerotignum sp. MB30-C6]|uniref:hypothetical protein n=1 Tax=Anaerotignum sp. MB30-C6 TaxID=3070814 RepID=UPI0027DB27AA|nr:hypothetical protein [Anaerotignum sp. MB30-C6]WMI81577.1 hypothetical protein RBQ60_02240 [Anaerotignum sp. MB30-C6]